MLAVVLVDETLSSEGMGLAVFVFVPDLSARMTDDAFWTALSVPRTPK